jgi:cytochrome c oxidase assembly protein Cox11
MLAAIWAVLEPYLREIFKNKLAEEDKRNSWKRTAIGRFMALYDSMVHLEQASASVYNEFVDVVRYNGVVTRTVVKKNLDAYRTLQNS